MKKFIVLLSALCVQLAFTACDEKPVRKGEITGKWEFSKLSATVYGGSPGFAGMINDYVDGHFTVEPGTVYTFKADKTGSYTSDDTPKEIFTYHLSGTELTITMEDESRRIQVETIHSITNAEMVWSDDITEEVNNILTGSVPGFNPFDKVLANKHFLRK